MISIFRHLFSQEVPKEPEVKTKFDYVRDRMYRNAFNCRRQIILDVETTGFNPKSERIVEIAAIELVDFKATNRVFWKFCNPRKPVPPGAFAVHGLSNEFLRDKPSFRHIADEFLEFVADDSVIVAHNSRFDAGFVNAELKRAGRRRLGSGLWVDSLLIARNEFPDGGNSLDELASRFGVDVSERQNFHGAFLDSRVLAETYLKMLVHIHRTGGAQ